MEKPENTLIVIFGASGDLTKRKLIPAFYSLYKQKLFCRGFAILGVGRTRMTDQEFRENLMAEVAEFKEDSLSDADQVNNFINNFHYVTIETSDEKDYVKLKECLSELDKAKQTNGNYILTLLLLPCSMKKLHMALHCTN